jgi:phosphoribosylanthranilate isomerase
VPGAIAQFHGDESPEQCWEASGRGAHRYMRAARIPLGAAGAGFDLVKYASDYSRAQAILLDAHVEAYGGGGKAFDWSLLPHGVDAHLVLSGGLAPANVGDGIRRLRTAAKSLAVDVSSGVEAAKGIKDAAKIREFVAAVRAADALT